MAKQNNTLPILTHLLGLLTGFLGPLILLLASENKQAKKHARSIVVCEPYAIKPQDITAYDPAAKLFIFMFKFLPERLFKYYPFRANK